MAKIQVVVRSDQGDLGIHRKFGKLVPGAKMTIDEEDFGAGLFERPHPDFLSPHEQADKARARELRQRVGDQEAPDEDLQMENPPPDEPGKPAGDLGSQEAPGSPGKANDNEEVTDHA